MFGMGLVMAIASVVLAIRMKHLVTKMTPLTAKRHDVKITGAIWSLWSLTTICSAIKHSDQAASYSNRLVTNFRRTPTSCLRRRDNSTNT
jgi:hypothetical protein